MVQTNLGLFATYIDDKEIQKSYGKFNSFKFNKFNSLITAI